MIRKTAISLLSFFIFSGIKCQRVEMYFPEFKGKTYDFVIFQGSEQKTLVQGTIPQDGKFVLIIPREYAPYTGMSRWLITGTKEGGGLDMYVPGHQFGVSCSSVKPNDSSIIYTGNSGNRELSRLSRNQDKILRRYEIMTEAIHIYTPEDHHYSVFLSERETQKKDYNKFQHLLEKRADYISEFIRIVNITKGIGTRLDDHQEETAENVETYITKNLNWEFLYTSGHWWNVISGWVSIHTNVLKDRKRFANHFETISLKLKSDHLYQDFVSRVVYFLKDGGNEAFLQAIIPSIKNSGRINNNPILLNEYLNATGNPRI
ncbi:alkyl hydroperoxide reductase [Elizabethkingia meningoseptica]|uniref:alkyl hydroperoxide reductase n=1 Tax=Elizabethkingia meningoseptica TaxID=238 RepID=UPI0023B04458|nr:alkyl hydroperoxide reductase [Elizabethkingia meningoseptica]